MGRGSRNRKGRVTRARSIRSALPLGTASLLGTLTGCATAAESEAPVDASYRDGVYQANGTY